MTDSGRYSGADKKRETKDSCVVMQNVLTYGMKKVPGNLLPVLIALILFSSCTGLRRLEEGEQLYTGSRIHIEALEPLDDDRNVKRELERVIRPEPNSSLLFSRPRLWLYQRAGEPTGRGVRHWMKNRLGEEPVLFDSHAIERNQRLIENRLFNLGYYDAMISHKIDSADRKARVDFFVQMKSPYRFGSLYPVESELQIAAAINDLLRESLIRQGEPYSLELLRNERRRIDKALKQQGYFYFHHDQILFRADTSASHRTVDIYTTLKADIPPAATRQYRIGNIHIQADYLAGPVNNMNQAEPVEVAPGVYFRDALSQFDPQTITRAIFFRKDSLYNADDHTRSLNHLMSLGTFRFVNIRFSPRESDGVHFLDVRVLLTPIQRRSLSLEARGVTKSNNFAGPGLTTSLTNHNLLKGAEAFKISTNAAYETLIGRQVSASSREFGMDASLSFPRFLLPFGWQTHSRVLAPKTNVSAGVGFMGRTDAFNLTTMNAQYTYMWNKKIVNQFRISPLVFSLYRLGTIDPSMEGILFEGTLLRRGLFEQFVLGGQYTYTYNSRLKPDPGNDWYIRLNLDLSGNLAYLLMNSILRISPDEDGGYGFVNQSFAQYTKADADVRYYYQVGEGSLLVGRMFLGAGLPYGNSDMMPYVKQYVIGGANSLRAFQPRSLGPGSYAPDDDLPIGYSLYQTGELKLEANLEFRFPLSGMFKGALFVDAGNIWRLREDKDVPGGKFETGTFAGQIALGTGAGLRIDAGFFLLRFDFAFPLANPAVESNGYFDPVRLHERGWRRDNLVFNLAIGYPF